MCSRLIFLPAVLHFCTSANISFPPFHANYTSNPFQTVYFDNFLDKTAVDPLIWTATNKSDVYLFNFVENDDPTAMSQSYDSKNVFFKNHQLHLRSLSNSSTGQVMSTARLDTYGKLDFLYGDVVVEALIPKNCTFDYAATVRLQPYDQAYPGQPGSSMEMSGPAIVVFRHYRMPDVGHLELGFKSTSAPFKGPGGTLTTTVEVFGDTGPAVKALWKDKFVVEHSDAFGGKLHAFKVSWATDTLTWFIDDVQVHRVTDKTRIPSVRMQLVVDLPMLSRSGSSASGEDCDFVIASIAVHQLKPAQPAIIPTDFANIAAEAANTTEIPTAANWSASEFLLSTDTSFCVDESPTFQDFFYDDFRDATQLNDTIWTVTNGTGRSLLNTLPIYGTMASKQQYRGQNIFLKHNRLFLHADDNTTARLDTHGKLEILYGQVEVRARIPNAPENLGLFPAVWLQNAQSLFPDMKSDNESSTTTSAGPAISVLNVARNYEGKSHHTDLRVYRGSVTGAATPHEMVSRYIDHSIDMSLDFHVFRLVWLPDRLVWYVDGREIFRITARRYIPTTRMQLVINLAVVPDHSSAPRTWRDESKLVSSSSWNDFALDYIAIKQLQNRSFPAGNEDFASRKPAESHLVIFDEKFDKGTKLNPAHWTIADRTDQSLLYSPTNFIGTSQTLRENNVFIQDQALHIKIQSQNIGQAPSYTTGQTTTAVKFNFLYGEIQVRARSARGTQDEVYLPGVWLQYYQQRPWPSSAYSDLYPRVAGEPPAISLVNTLFNKSLVRVYAGREQNGSDIWSVDRVIDCAVDFSDDFHVFKLIWLPDRLVWFIDGKEVYRVTDKKLIPAVRMQILVSLSLLKEPNPLLDQRRPRRDFEVDYIIVRQPEQICERLTNYARLSTNIAANLTTNAWTVEHYPGLIFRDDFSTSLNLSVWIVAGDGFATGILQGDGRLDPFYEGMHQQLEAKNVFVKKNVLHVRAKRQELWGNSNMMLLPINTGRLETAGNLAFLYGQVEARVRLPNSTVPLFPAIWLQNRKTTPMGKQNDYDVLDDVEQDSPAISLVFFSIGEKGGNTQESFIRVFGGRTATGGENIWSVATTVKQPVDMSADFHTFKLVWLPDRLVWYIDGLEVHRVTEKSIIPSVSMQLVISMAADMSAFMPFSPVDSSFKHADLEIDYVTIRQLNEANAGF